MKITKQFIPGQNSLGLRGIPPAEGEPVSPFSSGQQVLETQNRSPMDLLSRLLVQLPQKGEILSRLSALPPGERFQALTILLTLGERGISLSRGEWEELWTYIKKHTGALPRSEKDLKELFPQQNEKGENLFQIPGQPNRIIPVWPFGRDGKRGQIALSSKDGSDNLFIRMETVKRHWEFHLVKPRKKGTPSTLEVFTNDRALIDNTPGEWDIFKEKMKKKSIRVERVIKFLRKPLFLSENGRRELDHLVDIVL